MRDHLIPYDLEMPTIVKWIGGTWREGKNEYRMKWGELTTRYGLAFKLCLFESGYSVYIHATWLGAYIKLPFLNRWRYDPHEIMESWGVDAQPDSGVQFHWGRRTKCYDFPWRNWIQVSHQVMMPDGSWVEELGFNKPDGHYVEKFPYRYILKSGEVQVREATVYVERRTRALRHARWWNKTTYAIQVIFDKEVGEETGSWKGGCIGCGYELRPGETALQCLRRMEHERSF